MQPLNPPKHVKKIFLILFAVFLVFAFFKVVKDSLQDMNCERNQRLSVHIIALPKPELYGKNIFETRSVSGIVFWRAGYILTVAHLLDDNVPSNIFVKTFDRQNTNYFSAKILARDRNLDIMAIRISYDFGSEIPISNNLKLNIWEKIYAIGCLLNACNTYVEGNFITYGNLTADPDLRDYSLFDMVIASGSSGQGIFNKNGNLIGISAAYLEYQHRIAVGPEIRFIRKFLEDNRLPYQKAIIE